MLSEIAKERKLQWFGACLALTYVLSYFHMFSAKIVHSFLDSRFSQCWSHHLFCGLLEGESQSRITLFKYSFLLLATTTLFLFVFRQARIATYCLFATFLFKLLIFSLSYINMGNYHYMPLVMTFVFIFTSHRRESLGLFLMLIYFCTGFLKLNDQWFLGQAVFFWPTIPNWLILVASSAVIFLELVMAFLLLSNNRVWRAAALGSFALFHLTSIYWVGWFFPSIMACLLAFYFFYFKENFLWRNMRAPRTLLCALIFILAQLPPLFMSQDPAITTEGRFWALNMFDAKSSCSHMIYGRFRNYSLDLSNYFESYSSRISCDPLLMINRVQRLCTQFKSNPDFTGIDFSLNSKRATDQNFKLIIHEKDFCEKSFTYSQLLQNSFIKYEEID